MSTGLSVARLIAVSLSLTPAGAQFANFNSLLIMGESNVINVSERIRSYGSLEDVVADFGTGVPEFTAAERFFGQSPQPTQLYIGRWAQSATQGLLIGDSLTLAQQALSNFTTVTSGGFQIAINGGSLVNVSGINLSGATTLPGVATLINAALTTATVAASVSWNAAIGSFTFATTMTGASASVAVLTPPTSGTSIAGLLRCNGASNPSLVQGAAAESALAAVTAMDLLPTQWFAFTDDACPDIADADHEAIAAYIEAAATPHLYGFTSQEVSAWNSALSTDIGSVLQAGGYQRTFVFWSIQNQYTACGAFGDLLTTNLAGSNTTITLAYKQVIGEPTSNTITDSQADVLDSKGYNYVAPYNNGVSIITNGWCVCSSPEANQVFIDEIYGALALANEIQTNYFNLLVQNPKVPQTDAGGHLGTLAIEAALDAFVTNGYLAPGTWNSGGFGQLAEGDFLPKSYYVYQPPIASQQQANRTARQSVPYQIAAKTAGAIQSADISLSINP
jgi:hypothetical protein